MKIVAELALVHDGSLGNALALIDTCAAVGVDAVKMQCRDGDPCKAFRPGTSFPQDIDRESYWRRTGFTTEQWAMLSQWTHSHGIEFGLSAFSVEAVQRLSPFVDFWKVGSGSVGYGYSALLKDMALSGRDIVLSTGMSTFQEIRSACIGFQLENVPRLTVLHCQSLYPCPAEQIGLNLLLDIRDICAMNGACWGLSDHSGSIAPGIAACALGADMLEVHVCWDKRQFGPDVPASLTIDQLAELVRGVRYLEAAMANPVDKDEAAKRAEPLRRLFEGQESERV